MPGPRAEPRAGGSAAAPAAAASDVELAGLPVVGLERAQLGLDPRRVGEELRLVGREPGRVPVGLLQVVDQDVDDGEDLLQVLGELAARGRVERGLGGGDLLVVARGALRASRRSCSIVADWTMLAARPFEALQRLAARGREELAAGAAFKPGVSTRAGRERRPARRAVSAGTGRSGIRWDVGEERASSMTSFDRSTMVVCPSAVGAEDDERPEPGMTPSCRRRSPLGRRSRPARRVSRRNCR